MKRFAWIFSLVPEGNIPLLVSVSALTWFIRFIYVDKCNLLNSFFCSISNVELRTNSKLDLKEFTINEILDILKSPNIYKKKPSGTI